MRLIYILARFTVICLVLAVLSGGLLLAQQTPAVTPAETPAGTATPSNPPVPDLRGLSVPEAAARLNRVGLLVGATELLATANRAQANTIEGQSPPAGEVVVIGTPVDLTVWRADPVRLVYDDNDLTLISASDRRLPINGVIFRAVDGNRNRPAEFAAVEWAHDYLREQQCLQLWSVARNGAKEVPGCPIIQGWIYRTAARQHFWIGANGVTQFEVVQDGIRRGLCTVADGACEFYLVAGSEYSQRAQDVAEYLTLVYTADALWLVNRAVDRWLPTEPLRLAGTQPADPILYTETLPGITPALLAPGQCIRWQREGTPVDTVSVACEVIAAATVPTPAVYWLADFAVQTSADGEARQCPAEFPGEATLCLLPVD